MGAFATPFPFSLSSRQLTVQKALDSPKVCDIPIIRSRSGESDKLTSPAQVILWVSVCAAPEGPAYCLTRWDSSPRRQPACCRSKNGTYGGTRQSRWLLTWADGFAISIARQPSPIKRPMVWARTNQVGSRKLTILCKRRPLDGPAPI